MKETLAIIAALIATISTAPYLIDVVKKRTKPNIVSWLTWTVLTGIATAAAFAAHEPKTALLTLGSTFCTAAVVILGLRYGIAKFTVFDVMCQAGAVLGLIFWLLFHSPDIGIIVPVVIDFFAALPTLRHSWREPAEETWQTFMIGVIAAMLTVLSLTRHNIASTLYPAYLIIANGAIVVIVIYRRLASGITVFSTAPKTVREEN